MQGGKLKVKSEVAQSCPTLLNPWTAARHFPGKNAGVGCHFLLQLNAEAGLSKGLGVRGEPGLGLV